MAEPRKVQFVTLSAFAAGTAAESRKRRLETEEEADFNFDRAGEAEAGDGAGGIASNGRLGKTGDRDKAAAERRATVRLNLSLSEPDERTSAEFNYGELIQNLQVGCSAYTLSGPWETTAGVILHLLEVFIWTCHSKLNGGKCTLSFRGIAWLKVTITTAQQRQQLSTLQLFNFSSALQIQLFITAVPPPHFLTHIVYVMLLTVSFSLRLAQQQPSHSAIMALGNATCSLALWQRGAMLMEGAGCGSRELGKQKRFNYMQI